MWLSTSSPCLLPTRVSFVHCCTHVPPINCKYIVSNNSDVKCTHGESWRIKGCIFSLTFMVWLFFILHLTPRSSFLCLHLACVPCIIVACALLVLLQLLIPSPSCCLLLWVGPQLECIKAHILSHLPASPVSASGSSPFFKKPYRDPVAAALVAVWRPYSVWHSLWWDLL